MILNLPSFLKHHNPTTSTTTTNTQQNILHNFNFTNQNLCNFRFFPPPPPPKKKNNQDTKIQWGFINKALIKPHVSGGGGIAYLWRFSRGALIQVEEIETFGDHLRARVDVPAGWITLKNTATGKCLGPLKKRFLHGGWSAGFGRNRCEQIANLKEELIWCMGM